jgi:hypothetical protein
MEPCRKTEGRLITGPRLLIRGPGFDPVRLFLHGWEGNMSVKWLPARQDRIRAVCHEHRAALASRG